MRSMIFNFDHFDHSWSLRRKPRKQKEPYAQSLTPFFTYFRLELYRLRQPCRHLACTGNVQGATEPVRVFSIRRVRARLGHRELQRQKLDAGTAHIVAGQERPRRGIPAKANIKKQHYNIFTEQSRPVRKCWRFAATRRCRLKSLVIP